MFRKLVRTLIWVFFSNYRHAFATLSFVAEIFIFLYVGMDALDIEKWRFVSDRYDFLFTNYVHLILLIVEPNVWYLWHIVNIKFSYNYQLTLLLLLDFTFAALENQWQWFQYCWVWYFLEEQHLCSPYLSCLTYPKSLNMKNSA